MPKYKITLSKYSTKIIRASSLELAEERAKKMEKSGWEITEVRIAPEQ